LKPVKKAVKSKRKKMSIASVKRFNKGYFRAVIIGNWE